MHSRISLITSLVSSAFKCTQRRTLVWPPYSSASRFSSASDIPTDSDSPDIQRDVLEGDFFHRLIQRFPSVGCCMSFAYGSGVFQQDSGIDRSKNVTDLIFVVDNPVEWHRENLLKNKSDYSGLLRLLGGADLIAKNQDAWGARLHFNTLVPFENGLIKYGVISRSALLSDCLDWEHLYASGRLHKPVRILEIDRGRNDELTTCLRLNLQSALHTALLLLPETFTEEALFTTLAGLSYQGDFRMVIGEDKNKVTNIVRPSLSRFRQLYARRLRSLSDYVEVLPSRGRGDQDTSPSGRFFHLSQLPKFLQRNLVMEWNKDGRYRDVEEVLRSAAYDRDSDVVVHRALKRIVIRASITQAIKGIVTAGMTKTVKYSGAKLRKMYLGYIRGIHIRTILAVHLIHLKLSSTSEFSLAYAKGSRIWE